MTWFEIEDEPLSGLLVLRGNVFVDNRGEFSRLYSLREIAELTGLHALPQVNFSLTHQVGSIRGMHFQRPPYTDVKLVRCIRGCVWDVAVDLRQDSTTFLQHHAQRLSADNNRIMLIPEGFGHGFQVLEEDSELIYFHSQEYRPASDSGFRHDDPALAIGWPLPVSVASERDLAFPLINKNFTGF